MLGEAADCVCVCCCGHLRFTPRDARGSRGVPRRAVVPGVIKSTVTTRSCSGAELREHEDGVCLGDGCCTKNPNEEPLSVRYPARWDLHTGGSSLPVYSGKNQLALLVISPLINDG